MIKLRRSFTILLLLLALGAGLNGCASSKDDDAKAQDKAEDEAAKKAAAARKKEIPICPQVAILRELDTIKDYGTEKPDDSQLVSEAKMKNVTGDCAYQKDGDTKVQGIDINFDLNLVAAKGPRLGGLRASFPYFVAVVAPDQTILSKEKMTAEFHFSSSSKISEHVESLHVFVPLPKDKRPTGPDYRVLMGFQLSEDQLAEIRKANGDGDDAKTDGN